MAEILNPFSGETENAESNDISNSEEAKNLVQGENIKSKEKLLKEFEVVKNREREINSKNIITNNNILELKDRLIQEFFSLLKEYGIDPSDENSIRQFREKLEQEDPDLAELFGVAFDNLLKEGEGAMAEVTPNNNISNEEISFIPPKSMNDKIEGIKNI